MSCKELREATEIRWFHKGLTAADLATLAKLGSLLPALQLLFLAGRSGLDGVPRLAKGLVAGALPALRRLIIADGMHVGDAGAAALAAALGRGAMPRLKRLVLRSTRIGDEGLVALAPALRRLPALEHLDLRSNSFGDEGLAALVAPPPAAGALRPPTGVLTRLKKLDVGGNWQITDAGCATLTAAIDSGILPVIEEIDLKHIHASDASRAAVQDALTWRLTNFRTAEVAHEVAHALLSLGS